MGNIRELIYTGRIEQTPLCFDGTRLRNLWAILRAWPETEMQLEREAEDNASWMTAEYVVLEILSAVQDARSREQEALSKAVRAVQERRQAGEEQAGAPWREIENILQGEEE